MPRARRPRQRHRHSLQRRIVGATGAGVDGEVDGEENGMFRAIVTRDDDGVVSKVEELDDTQLPEGDVTVRVEHSAINYKDGLCLTGKGRIVRTFPHVPGIDFAGTVEASDHADFAEGDPVVLTGWRVGEVHWGGLAQRARVSGDWLLRCPDGLSSRDAAAAGTAGLTAALAIREIEGRGCAPGSGPVLVTGASGGVGSFAVAMLASRGHEVVASSGSPERSDYLRSIGAAEVIDREEVSGTIQKPLEKERWAGVVDTVGGPGVGRIATQVRYGAPVAAIGLPAGSRIEIELITFFVRAVALIGIDSVLAPNGVRREAWDMIASHVSADAFEALTTVHPLEAAPGLGASILAGGIQGRAVIDVNA